MLLHTHQEFVKLLMEHSFMLSQQNLTIVFGKTGMLMVLMILTGMMWSTKRQPLLKNTTQV